MLQKILVPLDGSELAEKALPYAASLAEKFAGELILLMVIERVAPYAMASRYGGAGAVVADFPTMEEKRNDAELYLQKLQNELGKKNIPTRVKVLENEVVADGIIGLATEENIDVIVKTTHGRSGISRWVYGNVATKVLQGAPCPIFLVRVSGK